MKKTLVASALLLLTSGPGRVEANPVGMVVTEYCSTGTMADGNYTYTGAAAGASWLPFGSVVWVPGIGSVTIEDRGQPGLFGVDVFTPDCERAWNWGRRWMTVWVEQWGWRFWE